MVAQTQFHGKELVKMQVQDQPKNLLVLRRSRTTRLFDVHPLVEAFNAEHGTNLKVVSHKVADVALTVGETWRRIVSGAGFVVDASIAFEKRGAKLGKEMIFFAQDEPRVVLATGRYKGEKDVALVTKGLTYADVAYTINGKQRTLQELLQAEGIDYLLALSMREVSEIRQLMTDDRLILVPNFSGPSGWYTPHSETGVPHGRKVDASSDARYLYRLNDSSYVGLLVRFGGCGRRSIDAYYWPSYGFGVVAEVPEADAPKIEALLASNFRTEELAGVAFQQRP
ncbi:MAG: hypothetical protein V1492_00030 [Candidatus Micrarchaeota archaeon]